MIYKTVPRFVENIILDLTGINIDYVIKKIIFIVLLNIYLLFVVSRDNAAISCRVALLEDVILLSGETRLVKARWKSLPSVWRPKLSHKHFTIRVTYPDKCFVLFTIRVTYPVVRVTYPDKEVKGIYHYSEGEFTTVKENLLQVKGNLLQVKRNSLRWRELATPVKGAVRPKA